MEITRTKSFIQVGPGVRVEPALLRKRAVATDELLDDSVTARHYKLGALDAKGKKIVLGEPMDYIDWRNRKEKTYNVYAEVDSRYKLEGEYPTEEEALSTATSLANERAAR